MPLGWIWLRQDGSQCARLFYLSSNVLLSSECKSQRNPSMRYFLFQMKNSKQSQGNRRILLAVAYMAGLCIALHLFCFNVSDSKVLL